MWQCKLCLAAGCVPAGRAAGRGLLHCPACGLVFVDERWWLSPADERARYALHDNGAHNAGYVRFLSEVADVVQQLVPVGAQVLDFGCGENAVLAGVLGDRGLACTPYDPVYGIGLGALQRRYDVVVVCEVIEHLRELRTELASLRSSLAVGARTVIRTRLRPAVPDVPSWWYARDPTHINFFARQSLAVVASLLGAAEHSSVAADIHVFR